MSVSLLDYYHALAAASEQMLLAARRSDWDEVSGIERACKGLIDELNRAAERNPLTRAEQLEKMRIMHRIVVIDAEVRNLAQPWLKNLDRMFAGRPLLPFPPDPGRRS